MKEYVATKQWRDGFGANETRITAADLIRIEDGISSATRGVTSLETVVQGQPAKVLEEVKKIAQAIRTELATAIPVGTIAMFGADRDPEGWLRCDGRVLQRSAYPALFAAIGTTYGSTNSGDFRIPDIRERSVVGTGTKYHPGDKGGNTLLTLSISQIPAHTHEIGESSDQSKRFQARTSNQDIGIGTSGYTYLTSTGTSSNERSPIAASTGGSQPIDLRDPYFGLPYIIKAS